VLRLVSIGEVMTQPTRLMESLGLRLYDVERFFLRAGCP
jgi:hypothetical protein